MKRATLILTLFALAAAMAATPARAQTTTIGDFTGKWSVGYIHNPDEPEDNLMNYYFSLQLEPGGAAADSLYGWHFSVRRGGRKIDGFSKDEGDPPSIRGKLCADTVYVRFESAWEVVGNAKLYFVGNGRHNLMWERGEYAPDKEHYMPARDTLYREIPLNDSISVRLREITREEYDSRKTAAAHLRPEPYKVVTGDEARRMLAGKVKLDIYKLDWEETERTYLDITYNDGRGLGIEYGTDENGDWFVEYYPEADVMVLESESAGEEVVDFTDSTPRENRVGNPKYRAVSPDGRWRVSGFFDGVSGYVIRWLEKWNQAKAKYEFFGDLYSGGGKPFAFSEGWFWTDNDTMLFTGGGGDTLIYEMTIIENEYMENKMRTDELGQEFFFTIAQQLVAGINANINRQ